MEDLRKNINTNKGKYKSTDINTNINILTLISTIFKFIRDRWKSIIFWLFVILSLNIAFNPKNTAEFLSSWYNNFVITFINNTK